MELKQLNKSAVFLCIHGASRIDFATTMDTRKSQEEWAYILATQPCSPAYTCVEEFMHNCIQFFPASASDLGAHSKRP